MKSIQRGQRDLFWGLSRWGWVNEKDSSRWRAASTSEVFLRNAAQRSLCCPGQVDLSYLPYSLITARLVYTDTVEVASNILAQLLS
jgi:hypothetical protein